MKSSVEVRRKRSIKHLIGGILGVVVALIGLLAGIGYISKGVEKEFWYETTNWTQVGWGITLIILGIAAAVGSIFALAKKFWGLALAGATCAVIVFWILGIPALLLIAFSKDDFDAQREEPIKTVDQFKPVNSYPNDPFNRGGGSSTL